MKLLLFKTTNSTTADKSLKIAQQFFPGQLEIFSDYAIDITFESNPNKPDAILNTLSTDELLEYIDTLDEPIFIATSNTVFSAECLNATFSAHHYYSNRFHNLLIQPTFDNDMLAYVTPTLLLYGDRRIYTSSNRITNCPVILYGDSKLISKIINSENKPLLSDGIFYGGEAVVLSPMPPLAWNLDKELPVLVSCAEWDAKSYIQNIQELC